MILFLVGDPVLVRTVLPSRRARSSLRLGVAYWFSPVLALSDPERWTSIPLLVKIFKLIINELSSVVEANSSRTAAGDWSQGRQARPDT